MTRTRLTRATLLKLGAPPVRREIPDAGAAGLRLVVQPSGAKSWTMRFRRPDGKPGNLPLGPFDPSDKEIEAAPHIGQPLTVAAARALAADVNRQRAIGVDVIALRQAEKQRQGASPRDQDDSFARHARDFVEHHARPRTRHWRPTARLLGLDYPPTGDAEPAVLKGSLLARWGGMPIAEIDGDAVYAVIDEAKYRGIPGLTQRRQGPSDVRGRKLADVLGVMFGWLHEHRRIKVNPSLGVHRPALARPRTRILNTKPEVRGADELRWFWQACETMGYPFGRFCQLLLLTGCRRQELARARWDEFSDDLATFNLPAARSKNHRAHSVPLPVLAQAILAGVPRTSETYVFSSDGTRPLAAYAYYKKQLDALMLEQARKECGKTATIAPFVLHDLRRSMASGCAAIGILPHVIEAALNHVSGSAKSGVAGIYNTERYVAETRTALARWASHVEGIVSGEGADNVVALRA